MTLPWIIAGAAVGLLTGPRIYSLIENTQISSPLARQLLHIACHAENIGLIGEARYGLFLDRW